MTNAHFLQRTLLKLNLHFILLSINSYTTADFKKTCRPCEAVLPSAYKSGIGLVIQLVLLSFRASLEADC